MRPFFLALTAARWAVVLEVNRCPLTVGGASYQVAASSRVVVRHPATPRDCKRTTLTRRSPEYVKVCQLSRRRPRGIEIEQEEL